MSTQPQANLTLQLQLLKLSNTLLVVLLLGQQILQLGLLNLQNRMTDLLGETLGVENLALLGCAFGGLAQFLLSTGDFGVNVDTAGDFEEDGC